MRVQNARSLQRPCPRQKPSALFNNVWKHSRFIEKLAGLEIWVLALRFEYTSPELHACKRMSFKNTDLFFKICRASGILGPDDPFGDVSILVILDVKWDLLFGRQIHPFNSLPGFGVPCRSCKIKMLFYIAKQFLYAKAPRNCPLYSVS